MPITLSSHLPTQAYAVDVCVVGGGLTGVCAALAAARHGARVLLMQDRPMLGGNSSSEMRVPIGGADRGGGEAHLRETGIIEELRLRNAAWNPQRAPAMWDHVLYRVVTAEPNITLLLNCSCLAAEMDGAHLTQITGWQLTTQTLQQVAARLFIDCSGDAILAPLTGARVRMGREGRDEFGESIAPPVADAHTMGMTCYFTARPYDTPQPYTPPPWAHVFAHDEEIPYGAAGHARYDFGYWTLEYGGERDTIRDTEAIRHELFRIVFGLWDHIKNRGEHGAENWALDWVQCLPGKRESRRYLGDYILTQHDIAAGGVFDDVVAYGGWTMDDHHPLGFWSAKAGYPSTIFHECPTPFGIPYRILYSADIDNLMCAGRNASCTHTAMSATRVMATCCTMGQAAGTAAALAVRQGCSPREVGRRHLAALQQALLRDDCYLPGVAYQVSAVTRDACLSASHGEAEPVRDGSHRVIGEEEHCWTGPAGASLAYAFPSPRPVREVVLILDSVLEHNQHVEPPHRQACTMPATLAKTLRLEVLRGKQWVPHTTVDKNGQRLRHLPVDDVCAGVRLTVDATWGGDRARVFAFYVE
jgi:hypothetical protein